MSIRSWITSSLVRHFPNTQHSQGAVPEIEAALNESFSFQVALRTDEGSSQRVRIEVECPADWSVRVRRVGFVPMRHHNTPVEPADEDVDGRGAIPGYVPDPLFDEESIVLPVGETHAFWVTISPGPAATPEDHTLQVRVLPDQEKAASHRIRVKLYDVCLEKRRAFPITHWFYVDALIDWYRTDLFDARFWDVLPQYMRNVADHGQDTLYVPVFTPPLDGVKRPSQLLHVTRTGQDTYRFDWRDVERYIELAQACGIDHFEWCHLFTQWGVNHALRIYEGQGRNEKLLWEPDTGATSETYRAFLSQFLSELQRFLSAKNILECSFFHVSDEPHGEEHLRNYTQARGLLKELAPWMEVMDALTEIEFARQGLTDMPIPSITTALDFVAEGIPSWCYYCCGPRGKYLNRLLDTPLPKIAMHGLLFYRWPFRGFLHWGYNYWYKSQTRQLIDPYHVQDGLAWETGWAYGDTFVVYPGADGPIDSLRWEVFGESLQDYALLQTLGIDREDQRLASLVSFADFPKGEAWRRQLRRQMLEQGSAT